MVWIDFLNRAWDTSLSMRARMMGAGKPKSSFSPEMVRVFFTERAKVGVAKARVKLSRPHQALPKMPWLIL